MVAEIEKKCPECGCTEFGKGVFRGDGGLMPVGKVFTLGCEVEAEICKNCGLIVSLRVKKPEKFDNCV